MKRGHVKGTKQEKPNANDWYKTIEAETLRRLEAEEAEQATTTTTTQETR